MSTATARQPRMQTLLAAESRLELAYPHTDSEWMRWNLYVFGVRVLVQSNEDPRELADQINTARLRGEAL